MRHHAWASAVNTVRTFRSGLTNYTGCGMQRTQFTNLAGNEIYLTYIDARHNAPRTFAFRIKFQMPCCAVDGLDF